MNVVPVDKNDISKCMVDIETRLEHLTGVLENVTGNNSAEGRIIDENNNTCPTKSVSDVVYHDSENFLIF